MALDSRNKRASAIGVSLPWRGMFPAPDGGLDQGDRQQVGLVYRGVLAESPTPPTPEPPDETLNPDIEPDLIGYLLGIDAITYLIDDRIYPLEAPQSADRPYIVYSIQNRFRDRAQDGETGLANMLVDFDCQGDSYADVRAMETALNTAGVLNGLHGVYMGDSWIQSAEITDASDDDTPPAYEDEQGIFHSRVVLDLWYEEAVPGMV